MTSTGNDPATSLPPDASAALPDGWSAGAPVEADAPELTALLRRHEKRGRGWAAASEDDLLVEVSARRLPDPRERRAPRRRRHDPRLGQRPRPGRRPDAAGRGRGPRSSTTDLRRPGRRACCSPGPTTPPAVVGAERGLDVQQIDSGAFADDDAAAPLAGAGRLRAGPHLVADVPPGRPPGEADLDAEAKEGVRIRPVERQGTGMPDEDDLRTVHDILESAFADHFNSHEETFDEFVFRLREDPGHRWDHWWIAELVDGDEPEPAGALVGAVSEGGDGQPDGSYVEYIGVLQNARGRGVAKSLLQHRDRRRRRPRPRPGRPRGRRRLPDRGRRPLRVDGLEDVVRDRVVAPRTCRCCRPPA